MTFPPAVVDFASQTAQNPDKILNAVGPEFFAPDVIKQCTRCDQAIMDRHAKLRWEEEIEIYCRIFIHCSQLVI